MNNSNMVDNATVNITGQTVDIIFKLSEVDYTLNFMLIWLISLAFSTSDMYIINGVCNDDKTITLQHNKFEVDYVLDKDNVRSGNLCFRFKTNNFNTAKRMINKVFDCSITKENYKVAEMQLTSMIYNSITANAYSKFSTDKLVSKYDDYIVSRQMLIKLYTLLGFDAPEHKAQMYINHSNLDTIRYSHMRKYRNVLLNSMKSVYQK